LTAFVGVSGSGSRYLWAPGSVKIAPGGVVTFSWSGGAAHDLSIPQLGFETPATTSGSYSVTFPAAGTYSIICVLHPPAMRGTVVVQ
jgi:plastocyanin